MPFRWDSRAPCEMESKWKVSLRRAMPDPAEHYKGLWSPETAPSTGATAKGKLYPGEQGSKPQNPTGEGSGGLSRGIPAPLTALSCRSKQQVPARTRCIPSATSISCRTMAWTMSWRCETPGTRGWSPGNALPQPAAQSSARRGPESLAAPGLLLAAGSCCAVAQTTYCWI